MQAEVACLTLSVVEVWQDGGLIDIGLIRFSLNIQNMLFKHALNKEHEKHLILNVELNIILYLSFPFIDRNQSIKAYTSIIFPAKK